MNHTAIAYGALLALALPSSLVAQGTIEVEDPQVVDGRGSASSTTQNVWGSIVVEPMQVQEAMGDPDLVVLHFGEDEDYLAGHIPGALLADAADFQATAENSLGLTRELPTTDRLQATLRALGIDDDSRILIYHARAGEPNLTRMLFTLDWAGLGDRTAAMLGGMEGWAAEGGAVERTAAPVPDTPGRVTVSPRDDVLVTAEEVAKLTDAPGQVLIDARAAAFYQGEREDREVVGHIPGASSIPHRELFTEARTYRSLNELGALFEAAGASPGDRIVAYCHVGFFATTIVTAARMLGYDAVLYDGSFEHWATSGRETAVP